MKKNRIIIYLCAVISSFMMFECGGLSGSSDDGNYIEETADYGKITGHGLPSGYTLFNNVWNKVHAKGSYSQKVFLKNTDGKISFGWNWNWPTDDTDVVAYPEIIYGTKPWDMGANSYDLDGALPFRAGTRTVKVNFNINLQATGVYDMAFSLWAVSDVKAPLSNISHEIMIWNVSNGGWNPAGIPIGTFTHNGVTYDCYKMNQSDQSGTHPNKWLLFIFAAREPVLNGSLVLSDFINYLASPEINVLTSDTYITSIELGNEVVGGTGSAEISDFSISIE